MLILIGDRGFCRLWTVGYPPTLKLWRDKMGLRLEAAGEKSDQFTYLGKAVGLRWEKAGAGARGYNSKNSGNDGGVFKPVYKWGQYDARLGRWKSSGPFDLLRIAG